MAKNNPHRRKKQTSKKAPKITKVQPAETELINEPVETSTRQPSKPLTFILMAVFGLLFIILAVSLLNREDAVPTPTQLQASQVGTVGSVGIPIESSGNLGQLGEQNTSGLQNNSSPSTTTGSPTDYSSPPSSQLQPTVDKCDYQKYNQPNLGAPCINSQ